MRIALGIEYDGSRFHGWQAQQGLNTVQSCVEKALSEIADTQVSVVCAGRTDTGVHATQQVIHFDCDNVRAIRSWVYGGNAYLPKDISIRWGVEVSDEFHARYSASARRYRYVIYNHSIRPAVFRSGVTWHYRPLNHELMHEAAQCLVGEHDFTSFRAIECQSNTPMRNVHEVSVTRDRDIIIVDITANAFLHHMVRNIVGTLMTVGSGKESVEWFKSVLDAKNRQLGSETAPPYGLYLVDVTYPDNFALPKTPVGPIFL